MKITRLKVGNSQFPEKKDIGDVVVMPSGDLFCWDGMLWQLVGGRFIPTHIREEFLNYIFSGWPDPTDVIFDLPCVIDLSVFVDHNSEGSISDDQKFVEKFIARVTEVTETCQKNLRAKN
jgi:hypothetical protein